MSNPISDRRRAERFAQLLDEAGGGGRHHVRTDVDNELVELVATGHRVRDARPVVASDPAFRADLRATLLATAEREGIGITGSGRATRRLPFPRLNGPRARARGAIVIGIAAGAIAVSGISAASENAVPGDALYGMKRSTERAQLALSGSDLSRGQLFLDFAHTRLAEAVALRDDPVGFAAVLDDMDADTRQGVRLLSTSAVRRQDAGALDALNSFLTAQRRQVSALAAGAGRSQLDRADTSLNLLDQIRNRTDALQSGLACGVEPSVRIDDLGPLPRVCTTAARQPADGQTDGQIGSTPAEQRTATRAPAQPRSTRSDPASSPTATSGDEASRSAPGQQHKPTG